MLEVINFIIMQGLEPFSDRGDAGRQLAQRLRHCAGHDDVLVPALPRGGVPVAVPIALALGAELDLMLVRKLGLPNQPECAMGAIGSGGVRVLHADVPGLMDVTQHEADAATASEQAELARRAQRYRGTRPLPKLAGRPVILVDDGVATGATMAVAVQLAQRQQPARLVVAVPVAPPETLGALQATVDEVVCLQAPERFRAVSQCYRSFGQTQDDEVQFLLEQVWAQSRDAASQLQPKEPI